MKRYVNTLQRFASLVAEGDYKKTGTVIQKWVHDDACYYGLCREHDQPYPDPPKANLDIKVRPLESRDADIIFGRELEKASGNDKYQLAKRSQLYQYDVPTCYVAVTENDEPCYMQWVITSDYNDQIQEFFKGTFPILQPNEALMEYAFTLPDWRRNRIMSEAMSRIAEQAFMSGVERLITFVGINNIGSLKGCKRAGFSPYNLSIHKWRLFRPSTEFVSLPDNGENLDLFSES